MLFILRRVITHIIVSQVTVSHAKQIHEIFKTQVWVIYILVLLSQEIKAVLLLHMV
jgi:hypothetical protein